MSNELESMKRELKDNIQILIQNNRLEEAEDLLYDYSNIGHDDIEIFSIKSVLQIMKNNYFEAEKIIMEGLRIQPYNNDLLFNMSYLMDIANKPKEALQYFCKARLFNPTSDIKIQDVISNLRPIDNNNFKIIHGTIEIANQMHTMVECLKKLGVKAQTLNYYPSYLGYKSDHILNINSFADTNRANIETKIIASKLIEENDVFHFHFGTSLTLDNSDLPLLKELNKKVFMQHWGSDVRLLTSAKKNNQFVKVKNQNEDSLKTQLAHISKYISNCIVSDYELYEYVKDYYENIYIIKQAINLYEYQMIIPKKENKKLLIVHAPTSAEIKGTQFILKAIEELELKYDFEFKLIEGMEHSSAMKIYQQADIIVDQLLIGSYGILAIEAMAMGKPVICYISDFMKEKYSTDLPIISANPINIKEKIEYLINNKDYLNELGVHGRQYVEKFHDASLIVKQVYDLYNQ